MKIKIVKSSPVDIQSDIDELIGKEFQTLPYKYYDKEVATEMKETKSVGIMYKGSPYTINKDEYVIIE